MREKIGLVDLGVALPTEGVDRNTKILQKMNPHIVALPTEGVDRNQSTEQSPKIVKVALPTEGVDRNASLFAGRDRPDGRPPHGGRG